MIDKILTLSCIGTNIVLAILILFHPFIAISICISIAEIEITRVVFFKAEMVKKVFKKESFSLFRTTNLELIDSLFFLSIFFYQSIYVYI